MKTLVWPWTRKRRVYNPCYNSTTLAGYGQLFLNHNHHGCPSSLPPLQLYNTRYNATTPGYSSLTTVVQFISSAWRYNTLYNPLLQLSWPTHSARWGDPVFTKVTSFELTSHFNVAILPPTPQISALYNAALPELRRQWRHQLEEVRSRPPHVVPAP
jgi:hypothetical protein